MIQAVILAAGKGTRMRSETPKVLHRILGRAMIDYVLDAAAKAGARKPVVVIGASAEKVRAHVRHRAVCVLQREQRGTGHAVMMTRNALSQSGGDVLIWPGDMPMVRIETLKKFIRAHRHSRSDVSVLSSVRSDPRGYGRIIRAGGRFCGIREELDATEPERRIQEVNTGIYLFGARHLFRALREIRPENRKNELYLTDTIEVLASRGARLEAFPFAAEAEGHGVNSRVDLGEVNEKMNRRNVEYHQAKGVTFVSPSQTFIEDDVRIGQDSVIYPWCYIEAGVRIGRNCEIGPSAKLRSGTVIGDGSVVGSFVEVTRSRLGKKVMAKHLAYLGDSVIGDGTNIGAGTITANFDGREKHKTRVGRNVLVGSDTVFVAPVHVADGARTGAGSVITSGTRVRKGETVAGVPARALAKKRRRA